MEKNQFKEQLLHGTPAFPVAIYNNLFDKQYSLLAPLHYHNEFELLVATNGSLSVQIEDKLYHIKEGHGIFINSGLLHIINSDERIDHGFIAVVFDFTLLCSKQDVIFHKYIQPLLNGTLQVPLELSADICAMVHNICTAYETADFGFEMYIKHSLIEIFHSFVKNATSTTLPAQNAKSLLTKCVLDYIEQNYADSISLQNMADHAHVSKEYLCRAFHTMSDTTPVEYLNRYRIRQSTLMLLHTDKSISDIALSCGFNNSSYFNKMFLRYMDCTPTKYRSQNTFNIIT